MEYKIEELYGEFAVITQNGHCVYIAYTREEAEKYIEDLERIEAEQSAKIL